MKLSTRITGLIPALAAVPVCLSVIAPTTALAETDCTPESVANTVSSATGAASNYLTAHPDANQVVVAAYSQPRPVASANLRAYFTAHPQQYQDLRGILAPIGDTQQRCNMTVLSPELATAYTEFMAG
ncbi:heme-binding protein [Mycolicibacterium sp. lyk4-40-TYG-92]|uniref:heme-binding protein n=1 Tax=Mycolicibacterium sp. lyk4-40-TYG-92 TaxID=3040295 RepID=UPI002549C435|nr:heme-binding protein [Mycolicibacterium sp. lyk4-40-TYG-92]